MTPSHQPDGPAPETMRTALDAVRPHGWHVAIHVAG